MMPDQMGRPCTHRRQIQIARHLPDQPRVMGRRRAPHQQAEEIAPFQRREPRVPVIGHGRGGDNRHRLRLEVVVQRLGQAERVPVARHVAMRNLRQRMHARIGAPGGGDAVRAGFQPVQRILDRALHRRLIRLRLPSGKGRAVIFDPEGIAWHGKAHRGFRGPAQSIRAVARADRAAASGGDISGKKKRAARRDW